MNPSKLIPVIGIPACAKDINGHMIAAVGQRYVQAVLDIGGLPLLVPPMGGALCYATLMATLDGIVLTGSPSNVEPHHYEGTPSREGTVHDPARDSTTLPLIRAAVQAGVPIMAICRGNQELNVALGGTLHQLVHELPGRIDHRMPREGDTAVKFAHAHKAHLTPGGLFARLLGKTEIIINSLHAQAIDRPAADLVVEAVAPDGTIEAVSHRDPRVFAMGLQWHVEWQIENEVSAALFGAFADATRARAARRLSALAA